MLQCCQDFTSARLPVRARYQVGQSKVNPWTARWSSLSPRAPFVHIASPIPVASANNCSCSKEPQVFQGERLRPSHAQTKAVLDAERTALSWWFAMTFFFGAEAASTQKTAVETYFPRVRCPSTSHEQRRVAHIYRGRTAAAVALAVDGLMHILSCQHKRHDEARNLRNLRPKTSTIIVIVALLLAEPCCLALFLLTVPVRLESIYAYNKRTPRPGGTVSTPLLGTKTMGIQRIH